MIITCPDCKTQYAVPEKAISEAGRSVKCSRCKAVWFQEPLQRITDKILEPEPEAVEPIPEQSNLPTVPRKRAGIGLKLVCILLSLVACTSGAMAYRENIPQIAHMLQNMEMYKTEGLEFKNFAVRKERVGNRLEFYINSDIINNADEERRLPDIIITILSKGGNVMSKLRMPAPQPTLAAGEMINIQPEISNISGSAGSIVLDLGNPWELALR